jgi:hypothetical protein
MLLHRAANDALRAAGIPLIPLGPTVSTGYVEKTLRSAYEDGASWGPLVRVEDWPLNIEGGAFLPDGSCVLGLRFPVTDSGQPILLRCRGLGTLFDEEPRLEMSVAGILAHGQRDRAVGVRGLQPAGDRLHLLTGPIGSVDKTSSVARDYPGSALASCEHWSLGLDAIEQGGTLEASLVRRFEDQSIEGLAPGRDGKWFYSVDVAGAVELQIAA